MVGYTIGLVVLVVWGEGTGCLVVVVVVVEREALVVVDLGCGVLVVVRSSIAVWDDDRTGLP